MLVWKQAIDLGERAEGADAEAFMQGGQLLVDGHAARHR